MAHLRGLALVIWTYGLMAVMGLICAPVVAVAPRRWIYGIIHLYVKLVLGAARLICGLRTETRGPVPTHDALIAAKHQSFLDILILTDALPGPRFVMKKSLVWAPVLGFYARRIGCIAVDRGAGAQALLAMVEASARDGEPGQLVIYPQGTRVLPGLRMPYKTGVTALQEALARPVIPVATNAGLFWPRKGIARYPGLAVVEFLEPIPAGLTRQAMLGALADRVEGASDALAEEARGG